MASRALHWSTNRTRYAIATARTKNQPTTPTTGGAEMYYVRLRNRTTGPFDLSALQRMARQGQLSRLHQVSTDQRTWRGAGTVEGVFG